MRRSALYFLEPGKAAVCQEDLPPPRAGQVLVRAAVSAISPGSELLAYRGLLPAGQALDASIPGMDQAPVYPFKYGYSLVGEVVELAPGADPAWLGQAVFAFHPHETLFWADPNDLLAIPAGLSAERAALLPNMETAVNFLHDGAPLAGESVLILGQGVVGLLTTALLARFPLRALVSVDRFAMRRELSLRLGAQAALDPGGVEYSARVQAALSSPDHPGADLVYELSGSPAALDAAIAAAGFNARVVIGSWYGQKRVDLNLGGAFHRSRIQLISSQVSSLNPALSGRWSKPRRLDWAWRMLSELPVETLITHRLPFPDAAQAYHLLDRQPDQAVQVMLEYEEKDKG